MCPLGLVHAPYICFIVAQTEVANDLKPASLHRKLREEQRYSFRAAGSHIYISSGVKLSIYIDGVSDLSICSSKSGITGPSRRAPRIEAAIISSLGWMKSRNPSRPDVSMHNEESSNLKVYGTNCSATTPHFPPIPPAMSSKVGSRCCVVHAS